MKTSPIKDQIEVLCYAALHTPTENILQTKKSRDSNEAIPAFNSAVMTHTDPTSARHKFTASSSSPRSSFMPLINPT